MVKVHPTNSQIAYYTGSPFGSVWRTTDGFATVQQVYNDSTLASDQIMADIEIAQSNPNTIWAAATGYFLYKSTNGGASWTKITAVRDAIYGTSTTPGTGSTPPTTTTIGPLLFSNAPPAQSFLRFFNANEAAGTVTLTVHDNEGTVLGTMTRAVPARAAPQLSMREIEVAANVTIHQRTGTFGQLDVRGDFSGFVQHVVYDGTSGRFSNLSICRTTSQSSVAATNGLSTASNVHSTLLPEYPSRLLFQNSGSAATTVSVQVFDAATGSTIGQWTSPPILRLGAISVPASRILSELGATLTSSQFHLNLAIDGAPSVTMGHIVENARLGLEIDMSSRCAF